MKKIKVYTEADLQFDVKDEHEKQIILDYLNNPNVKDSAFKAEIAKWGITELTKRSEAELLRQYRETRAPIPKRY
jgi:hypothetical protein